MASNFTPVTFLKENVLAHVAEAIEIDSQNRTSIVTLEEPGGGPLHILVATPSFVDHPTALREGLA
jgi:hypothetical protein